MGLNGGDLLLRYCTLYFVLTVLGTALQYVRTEYLPTNGQGVFFFFPFLLFSFLSFLSFFPFNPSAEAMSKRRENCQSERDDRRYGAAGILSTAFIGFLPA